MKKVLHIVGARPNFMKVAPIHRAIRERGVLAQTLVHTGQHYDVKMSDVFFTDLGMPAPDVHLGIGSGSHTEQTARVMIELEKVFTQEKPDLVSVVGDVNSTLAGALVAVKMGIKLAHVEAGLRSGDRTMPEEINRLLVDRISDLLLTPSADADANLLREGIEPERIRMVGNVMIDSLLSAREQALRLPTLKDMGFTPRGYAVCTLHRASNVDDEGTLRGLLSALGHVASRLPVVFPVHPRTRKRIADLGLGPTLERTPGLRLVDPLGYLEFLALTSQARLVFTDSGGLQEETTVLGIPCLTVRENTERPITVDVGTNLVVGTDPAHIQREADRILDGHEKKGRVPDGWDGHSGERIAQLYEETLGAVAAPRRAAV
ncbi:UDP-N-acetylglucosamine 2-epimerase [Cystobacter fuscus DSM 2262]|uniref:UDP-N-acetylglucosamine 2-epimerase n=1 Tax=Cystobacter fuscus (strain ATCC 25194 / DSM 2262 / NBRC 100088 / M29) TaxID=1242864 RepID=S9P804_CYSF2|nr:UDP-N-acetylglucosamine 2-epimerase (non-hydrolyzing) [Cystobacter fuscus]EPX60560.1 UDP-N-acetylglucosamine 2-epimerase [Cystobacter fuscus DSM 2262]